METAPPVVQRPFANRWRMPVRYAVTSLLGAMVTVGAIAAQPIRIGQSLPSTPESYRVATAIGYATDALVAAVNARGGVQGVPIELVTLKDDGSTEGYARNVERLLADKAVLAIVNCTGDARCVAGGQKVAAHDAVMVGTLSGEPALRTSPGHVFPVRADYPAEAASLARQLATIGVGSAAILTDGSSQAAKRRVLSAALKASGVQTSIVEVAADARSMERAVTALEKQPPNALLLDLGAASLAVLGDIVTARKPKLPSIIASLADPELALSLVIFRGRTFGFTSVVPNPESLTSQLAAEFRKDLVDAPYGITYVGLEAYLNLSVVIKAIETSRSAPSRKSLQQALTTLDAMRIGELDVAPSGLVAGKHARVGLGVISARGIVLE